MVGISKNTLKRDYPSLHKEIEEHEAGHTACPKVRVDRGRGYEPSIIDFLQRCNTDDDALEIISYLEKRGEISKACADSLRKDLKEKGLRSFGERRKPGYYDKKFG